eukprot:8526939-Pyramimonas_sp.AAC.1
MTRTIRVVSGPSSGSRPSSELWIRQADAPDVFKSIPLTTSTVAPQQPELSSENRPHLSRSDSRPSSELCIQQTNATDDSKSVSVHISSVAVIYLELSTENRERLSRWNE